MQELKQATMTTAEHPDEARSTAPESGARRLILALDLPSAREAAALVAEVARTVGTFKVGLELFHAEGPAVFATLKQAGAARIWYDGKFDDIPNTVGRATRRLAPQHLWMINVHATAGSAAMAAVLDAAAEGARAEGCPRPRVLAVTLLTSLDDRAVREELGLPGGVQENVVRLARLAQATGLDGVVCSPLEAAAVRRACGPGFLIVTPGIRSAAAAGDQQRLATPAAAVAAGADYLVVGREITSAADPRAAAARLAQEAEEGGVVP
jgi:orotidine-5'-phosphate decarboxylase